jgi:hypothetical protein
MVNIMITALRMVNIKTIHIPNTLNTEQEQDYIAYKNILQNEF